MVITAGGQRIVASPVELTEVFSQSDYLRPKMTGRQLYLVGKHVDSRQRVCLVYRHRLALTPCVNNRALVLCALDCEFTATLAGS